MNDIIKNHRDFVANQIEKSFDSGINVPQQLDIEKAKWKVGDEKQYQGVTWVVGGFNAKGVPLWRKKKDSGAAVGGSATPKAARAAANKTPEAPKSTGNAFDFNSGSSDWEVTKKDWQTQYRNEKLGVGVHVDKFGWYVVQNNRGYSKRWKTKEEAVKSVQEAAADQASVKSAPAAKTAPAQNNFSANKIIGLLTISDSKYKDISKVVAVRTDKGNYAMEYDGSNTGLIINSKILTESELKRAGVEIKEPKKAEEKPIVPNAILQYGNRLSRELDGLYKVFDEKYKNYTADQLQKEIDKMGNAIYNEKYMYRAMQRDGAGKISLNRQGNRVDEVIAKSYTLKRLLEIKKANSNV